MVVQSPHDPAHKIIRRPVLAGMPHYARGPLSRRASILATTRKILASKGYDNITIGEISTDSGISVQTIYNLVGGRSDVIEKCLTEYVDELYDTICCDNDDSALIKMVESWWWSTRGSSEFCRAFNMMYFGSGRGIFYKVMERQALCAERVVRKELAEGRLCETIDAKNLAALLSRTSNFLHVEWADRPFDLQLLRSRLIVGIGSIILGALPMLQRPEVELWLSEADDALRKLRAKT